jgi:hypothetical protein
LPPRDRAASTGKLIITSAALKARPANQPRSLSSDSMKARLRSRLGCTKPLITLSAIARAIGLAKKGIGPVRILWKTSAINSGGIAEPSAK